MDKTLEAVVNRHLAAENQHRMAETLAELHPDCLFEDLPLSRLIMGAPEQKPTIGSGGMLLISRLKVSVATGRRTAPL